MLDLINILLVASRWACHSWPHIKSSSKPLKSDDESLIVKLAQQLELRPVTTKALFNGYVGEVDNMQSHYAHTQHCVIR